MENGNPYTPPEALLGDQRAVQYAGFWRRVLASLIDTVLLLLVLVPIGFALYGASVLQPGAELGGAAGLLLQYVIPAAVIIVFWVYKSATPGKMLVSARIADAKTGGKPSVGQCIGRYLGYFVSTVPLGLGILWVAWDRRKQGWHDKLAGTVVVRDVAD